jgi:3D (Asp-Asp-Asp) domain-containing protein
VITKPAGVLQKGAHQFKLRLLMTAYVPRRGAKTATGKDANHPGIAADFSMFPPGTKIALPGRDALSVDDTGGAMRQDARKGICHIDLRIPRSSTAHRHAREIGKQWIDAYVIFPQNSHNG